MSHPLLQLREIRLIRGRQKPRNLTPHQRINPIRGQLSQIKPPGSRKSSQFDTQHLPFRGRNGHVPIYELCAFRG
jgi:hypothetical protein